MISPVDLILSKLQKVRRGYNGQWMAQCPAHNDKSPSLSIRETPEGGVLIHCFAECRPESITQSIGLNLSDLYPPKKLSGNEPGKIPKLLTPSQALDLLSSEASLLVIVGENLLNGVPIKREDLIRCGKAVGRISWVKSECMGLNS